MSTHINQSILRKCNHLPVTSWSNFMLLEMDGRDLRFTIAGQRCAATVSIPAGTKSTGTLSAKKLSRVGRVLAIRGLRLRQQHKRG